MPAERESKFSVQTLAFCNTGISCLMLSLCFFENKRQTAKTGSAFCHRSRKHPIVWLLTASRWGGGKLWLFSLHHFIFLFFSFFSLFYFLYLFLKSMEHIALTPNCGTLVSSTRGFGVFQCVFTTATKWTQQGCRGNRGSVYGLQKYTEW